MPEDTSLRDFILGYCRQLGAVVEPPAYGVYETLFPDEVAARWGVFPYQFLAFALDVHLPNGEEITFLHYGHPLVETIVAELRAQTADTQWFINPTRLEKPGLAALAEKTYEFPNARLSQLKAGERRRMHQYVCFNFKTSLIADEKREMIVPLWMSLQGGHRVNGTQIQASALLETVNEFSTLEAATPSWHNLQRPDTALSPDILLALLDRARTAILDEMGPTLDAFQLRLARFLELDRARLTDYYAGLQRDLERRLVKADDERRPGLESKLAALHTERQAKLADAEEKYRLRVELELINLAVIAQPKLELDIVISKRTATTRRTVLWDPLLHVLEPFICDVCGQPGNPLWLCEHGHLAHADCLSPQCLDCKRTFCRLCAEQMHQCVVCNGAVCVHSLVKCKQCGRETCQKHATLCHAADGQLQRLEAGLPAPPVSPPPNRLPAPADQPIPQPKADKPGKPTRPVTPPSKKAKSGTISPVRSMKVEIDITQPVVTAFVNHKGKQIAARWWELAEAGIQVGCQCEKGWSCPDHGKVLRPLGPEEIQGQIIQQIRRFAQEYQVAQVKTKFFHLVAHTIIPLHRFGLGEKWKDPALIALAQAGYDKPPTWQRR
jgi:hypothetical protein